MAELLPTGLIISALNQVDDGEKAVQVQRMGDIYRQARKVHVWPGEGFDQDRLPEILSRFRALVVSNKVSEHAADDIAQSTDIPNNFGLKDAILQFFVLAMVPSAMDSAGNFLDLASGRSFHLGYPTELENSHTSTIKQVTGLQQGRRPILDLLWMFDAAQCYDERDKLFALFGMASNISPSIAPHSEWKKDNGPDDESIHCSVDYVGAWPSVYTRFSAACVDASLFVFLLLHTVSFGSLAHLYYQEASWVPNWSLNRSWEKRFKVMHRQQDLEFGDCVYVEGGDMDLLLKCRLYGPASLMAESVDTFPSEISTFFAMYSRSTWPASKGNEKEPPIFVYFSQILSAAVLDFHLNLNRDANEATQVLEEELFTTGTFNLAEIYSFGDEYDYIFSRLQESIETKLQNLVSRSDEPQEDVGFASDSVLSAVCELLHDRRTFYIEMPEDDVLLPGIGPPEMQHGDFVLQPRRNGYNEPLYKPLTVAFVVRPIVKGLQAVGRWEYFRFVGLCFLPIIDEQTHPSYYNSHHHEISLFEGQLFTASYLRIFPLYTSFTKIKGAPPRQPTIPLLYPL